MTRKLGGGAIVAALGLLLLGWAGAALMRAYPPYSPPLPDDVVLRVRVAGRVLAVPAAFLADRYTVAEGAWMEAVEGSRLPNLAFWMPRFRPEPVPTLPPMARHSLADRGARWAPDEWPVVAVLIRYLPPDGGGEVLPKQRARNRAAMLGEPEVIREPFGAERLIHPRDTDAWATYRHPPGTAPHFLLSRSVSALAPGCAGYVYHLEERLFFHGRFPGERIAEWREAVTAVPRLLARMEAAAKP